MRILSTLDRYVIRSVAVPAILAFFVYTFLLMMRPIFGLIEQVFVRGLPMDSALRIILVSVPHVVVLTIPLSYLFGVLLAVGRMNADNEIVALQAGGVSATRLLPPIMLVALVMTGINAFLFLDIIPRSSQRLREIQTAAFTSAKNIGRIEPKVFYEDFPNILLYVNDVDSETGVWSDVFIYDSSEAEERLTLAKHGRIIMTAEEAPEISAQRSESAAEQSESGDPWLFLEDVVAHQFVPMKPSTSRVNAIQTHLMKIPSTGASVRYLPSVREMKTTELVDYIRSGVRPGHEDDNENEIRRDQKLAGIELHHRISIPAACVVFALLALPLGIGSGASGKGRGFVMSILVVLVYFVMSSNGEMMALKDKVPVWLGMWFPNIALTLTAFFLMTRMGTWLGERQMKTGILGKLLRAIVRWIRKKRLDRMTRRHPAELTGSIPVQVQRRRYSNRFPTLLDRYVIQRLLLPLILVLFSAAGLKIVIDLSGKLDDFAKNQIGIDVMLAYYVNVIPQVIVDVFPMGLMISVLILLTLLERQQELTALKSGGVSLYRVMLPVLMVAAVCVGVMWFLEQTVVPKANRDAKRLQDVIKGRDRTRSYRADDRMWLLSRDANTFYKFLRYDERSRSLLKFSMFRLDDEMNLRFHLSAHHITYEDGHWIAPSDAGGWFRQFFASGGDEFKKITSDMELDIPEGPDYFGQEFRRSEEMSAEELAGYIKELKESAYRPSKLEVRLHQKFVSPLSALVFVLLALPFGLNRGGKRVSTMQGIGIALGLGIGYFLLVGLLGKMGEANLLPPAIGAWSPFVLATLFAVNRMSVMRT